MRRWHIADPANPEREPTVVAYPAAGTPNARVSLVLVDLDGARTDVTWDVDRDEYLAHVTWSATAPLIVVQPRDQRALRVLRVDPTTGATAPVHEDTDAHWVEIVPGVPAHTAAGAFVWITDRDGARRLLVDGEPVTPPSLQVRGVLDVDGDTVLLSASEDPTSTALWTWSAADGLRCTTPEPGLHGGRLSGGTLVVTRQALDVDGVTTTVHAAASHRRALARRRSFHRDTRRAHRTRVAARRARSPRSRSPPGWHRASPCTPWAGGPCAPRCCCRRGTPRGHRCRC